MNLLVLVADTFRADYLGCYGNDWIRTPHLDRLASEGVRFNDCYAEGNPTIPCRRVMYTGRRIFPFEYHHQKGDQVDLPGWHPLYYEDVTLAEWLSERGYTTGLVTDVYHQMKPGKNFQRGFHSWQYIRGQEVDPLVPTPVPDIDLERYVREGTPPDAPVRRATAQYLNNRAWWRSEADHYAAQVMRKAADWIRDYGHKRPWMLWVESFDPHEPWDAPREFAEMYDERPADDGRHLIWAPGSVEECTPDEFRRIAANYAGEVTHVDRWIGHVLEALDSTHQDEDTLVLFASDHGTMMGEQGQIHKGQDRLRIQCTRTPLIIRHPERQFAGAAIDGFIQHHDLMPTLLGLLGEPVPERVNGEDFWPLVTGDVGAASRAAPGGERAFGLRDMVVTGFGWYASLRTRDWNYQAPWARPNENFRPPPPELYDRRNDPDELVNVIEEHPEVAEEFRARLEEMLASGPVTGQPTDTATPAAIPGVEL